VRQLWQEQTTKLFLNKAAPAAAAHENNKRVRSPGSFIHLNHRERIVCQVWQGRSTESNATFRHPRHTAPPDNSRGNTSTGTVVTLLLAGTILSRLPYLLAFIFFFWLPAALLKAGLSLPKPLLGGRYRVYHYYVEVTDTRFELVMPRRLAATQHLLFWWSRWHCLSLGVRYYRAANYWLYQGAAALCPGAPVPEALGVDVEDGAG